MEDEAMRDAIRREEERRRRQVAGLVIFTVGLALLTLPLVVLDTVERASRPGLFAVMGVGLMIALAGFALAVRHMKNANTERVMARGNSRDRVQREYAQYVGYMPIIMGGLNFIALRSTWAILSGHGDPHDWGFAAVGPMCSLAILQVVAGLAKGQDKRTKRLLDDELVVSFRQRALNAGFGVAIAGMIIGFAAGLYDVTWGVMAMPVTLTLAAAASAFRYAMLDRQADPNG